VNTSTTVLGLAAEEQDLFAQQRYYFEALSRARSEVRLELRLVEILGSLVTMLQIGNTPLLRRNNSALGSCKDNASQ
jgi:hypothetical protein